MKIEGMMCGHCEARVKKCLEALPVSYTHLNDGTISSDRNELRGLQCPRGKSSLDVYKRQLTGYGSLGGANASSGVVVAQKEIKVERDSSRKVKQLNVEVGQEVKSGEVLFTYCLLYTSYSPS